MPRTIDELSRMITTNIFQLQAEKTCGNQKKIRTIFLELSSLYDEIANLFPASSGYGILSRLCAIEMAANANMVQLANMLINKYKSEDIDVDAKKIMTDMQRILLLCNN
jgi:hypothetical protein